MKVKVMKSNNVTGLADVEVLEGMHTGKTVPMKYEHSINPIFKGDTVETGSVLTDNKNKEYVLLFSKSL